MSRSTWMCESDEALHSMQDQKSPALAGLFFISC